MTPFTLLELSLVAGLTALFVHDRWAGLNADADWIEKHLLPAWLRWDARGDWISWIHHGLWTAGVGLVGAGAAALLGAGPRTGYIHFGWVWVGFYAVREAHGAWSEHRKSEEVDWLDHTMDVLLPVLAASAGWWWPW